MYQIDDFEYIYILTLLPLIWICFGLLLRWKKKVQMSFSRPELLEILSPNRSKFKPIFKLIVLSVSLFLLVIALMNPKIGTQLETVKREGVDIVLRLMFLKVCWLRTLLPIELKNQKD